MDDASSAVSLTPRTLLPLALFHDRAILHNEASTWVSNDQTMTLPLLSRAVALRQNIL